MKNLAKLSFYSLLLIVMSCTSDLNEGLNEEAAISDRDYWQSLLVMGGVSNDYIVQTEEGFVIDDDIIIEYIHFEERLEKIEEMARVKSEQIVTSRLRGSNCAGDPPLDNCGSTPRMNMIYLNIQDIPQIWIQATENAVNNWNAQNETNAIHFGTLRRHPCNYGGGDMQGTSVVTRNISNVNVVGQVSSIPELFFGFGGVPLEIRININHWDYASANVNRKTSTMMHEMGHAIGLMHPEGGFGSCLLTATTDNDCNSIMNSACRDRENPILTAEDRAGIRRLYPRLGDVRSDHQCIKIWGHCGNTNGCTTCPPGFTYDGANCYSGRHIPQGFTHFVLGRTLYTHALNGQCPPGFNFDGANCNSGTHYPPGFIPFVWNNTFYTVANCN